MHVSLATRNLDAGVAFYATLLGISPAKASCDYALFLSDEPPLELALDADSEARAGTGMHFGVVVDSVAAVDAQIARFEAAGYPVDIERDETCCYAKATKVWASDPDGRRWETYVVHEESETRDGDGDGGCCAA